MARIALPQDNLYLDGFKKLSEERGIAICGGYAEAARSLALLGAQVILHPPNLVLPYCQRAMFARAVENRVYIATCNRVGSETNSQGDNLTFTGASEVVSPRGEYLMTFDEMEAGIKTVEIDPGAADNKDLNQFNSVLRDLRPELSVH